MLFLIEIMPRLLVVQMETVNSVVLIIEEEEEHRVFMEKMLFKK